MSKPMPTEILYEQQILNGSTFYTLYKHTDPAECWKRLARCFYLHRQKDPSIRGIKVLTSPNLVVIYVLYAAGWRDLFQIPFEVFAEKN